MSSFEGQWLDDNGKRKGRSAEEADEISEFGSQFATEEVFP